MTGLAPTELAPPLLVERAGRVLVMTINRPEQRNAVDRALAVLLEAAMRRLDDDPELSVGVLTGSGGTFSAGMDLKAFLRGERPITDIGGFGGFARRPPRKPLVAAVEGWALAGGFEMVLACDLVVSGAGARFGLPEVKRGLVPRAGGAFRLPRRLPRAIALEMLFTGEPVPAPLLARHGLINEIVEDGQALAAALRLAERIGVNAPLALAACKDVAVASADWTDADAFEFQDEIFAPVFASADAREGAAAFVEKRSPVWSGR
jgi:enoyl-CoA hydratase